MTHTGKRGTLFIVSSPSGAGKTTLVERVCQKHPKCQRAITATTRAPREGEEDGKDYHFLSESTFLLKEKEGAFLETAHVFDANYGTLKKSVDTILSRGDHAFLVIDTQGAQKLMGEVPAIFIFVLPPDLKTLKERLVKRGTESEEKVELRLSWAEKEMALAPKYDYTIINDDLSEAIKALESIVLAEEHKVRKSQ